MNKNLFLGLVHLNNDEDWLKSINKQGIQVAANNFQWNFIDGLKKNFKNPLDIISTFSIGSYPISSNKLLIKSRTEKGFNGTKFKYIGFLNFYLIKGFLRFVFLLIELFKWSKKNQNGNIFIYSLYTPYLFSLFFVKKIFLKKKN